MGGLKIMINIERMEATHALLSEYGWDFLVIANPADFFWLTGCKMVGPGRFSALILTREPVDARKPHAIIPNLATAQVNMIRDNIVLHVWKDGTDPIRLLHACVNDHGAREVAVSGGLWSQHLLQLQAIAPYLAIVDASYALASLRARKDSHEIGHIREACARLESALFSTLRDGVIGRTEADIARTLFKNMIKEDLSILGGWIEFATGANSADPTHTFIDKVVKEGDPLLIDWGATYKGYYGDLCRTPVAGHPSDQFVRLYSSVRDIMDRVMDACVSGRTYGDLDKAYQDAVYAHGYDDHHIHRLGHGIGLVAHDAPFLQVGNRSLLEKSHTFTLEPGIYVEGVMGARIEHNLVFDGTRARKLDTGSIDLWCVN